MTDEFDQLFGVASVSKENEDPEAMLQAVLDRRPPKVTPLATATVATAKRPKRSENASVSNAGFSGISGMRAQIEAGLRLEQRATPNEVIEHWKGMVGQLEAQEADGIVLVVLHWTLQRLLTLATKEMQRMAMMMLDQTLTGKPCNPPTPVQLSMMNQLVGWQEGAKTAWNRATGLLPSLKLSPYATASELLEFIK